MYCNSLHSRFGPYVSGAGFAEQEPAAEILSEVGEGAREDTGGARSLALTLLRSNSLLTGKNTGNLRDFALENARFFSVSCTFC